MKYYLVAGERSGDLHSSNLMKEILLRDHEAQFRYFGGDYMQAVGGTLVKHYSDMNYMGLTDVLLNLHKIFKNLSDCNQDILAYKPDVVILVDFSGFNLKVAKFVHAQGLKVFYYISPKLWAWLPGRAHNIKKVVDRMFVILPFEKDFYKKYNYEVDYVGNPILDAIRQFKPNPNFVDHNQLAEKTIIAILPGSRTTEIKTMMTHLSDIVPQFSDFQFVIAGVGNQDKNLYNSALKLPNTILVVDQTYDLLLHAKAAIVTSGTATLETALFKVPQVVCYRVNKFTYLLKPLINVKYIALANLIADNEIVKELLQSEFTSQNVISEMKRILFDTAYFAKIKADYEQLANIMGNDNASAKTAELMVGYLK